LVSAAALYTLSKAFHSAGVTHFFPSGTSEAVVSIFTPFLAFEAFKIAVSRAAVSILPPPPPPSPSPPPSPQATKENPIIAARAITPNTLNVFFIQNSFSVIY